MAVRRERGTDLRCVLMSRHGRKTERCGDKGTGLRLLRDGAEESGLGSWARVFCHQEGGGGDRVAPVLHGQSVRCQSVVHGDRHTDPWVRSPTPPTHPPPPSPRRKEVNSLLCREGDRGGQGELGSSVVPVAFSPLFPTPPRGQEAEGLVPWLWGSAGGKGTKG